MPTKKKICIQSVFARKTLSLFNSFFLCLKIDRLFVLNKLVLIIKNHVNNQKCRSHNSFEMWYEQFQKEMRSDPFHELNI
jgi:hypothetical protein